MPRHAASVIHPFRTSGVNAPGYSRPPQQAAQARQQAPSGDLSVDLDNLGSDGAARIRAAQIEGVTGRQPFKVDPATPSAIIRLGKHKLRLPLGWQASMGRASDGSHVAFVLEPSEVLHVIVDRQGRLVELANLPVDVSDEFIRTMFKESPRYE